MIRKRPYVFERPPGWPALMTADIVCAYLGDISRQLLYRWTITPGFPKPTAIRGVKRWSRMSLDTWILARDADGSEPDSIPGKPVTADRRSACRWALRR